MRAHRLRMDIYLQWIPDEIACLTCVVSSYFQDQSIFGRFTRVMLRDNQTTAKLTIINGHVIQLRVSPKLQ